MKRTLYILFLSMLVILSCERNDMYDFAKNGGITIYALGDDGAVGMAIIANDQGYYKENFITGMGLPAPTDFIAADEQRRILVVRSSNIFSLNDKNSTVWNSLPTSPALDVKSSGDKVYLLFNNPADCLSHFDWSANALVSDGVSITNTPERFDFSSGGLYILADVPGVSKNIYQVGEGGANVVYNVPFAFSSIYFSVLSGNFYSASATDMYENNVLKGTGAPMGDYAVLSSSEIYGGALTANHIIRKNIAGAFQDVYTFPSTSGVIKIVPYKSGIIAVGISGAGADSGLYLYYSSSNSVKKISSRSVSSIFVR